MAATQVDTLDRKSVYRWAWEQGSPFGDRIRRCSRGALCYFLTSQKNVGSRSAQDLVSLLANWRGRVRVDGDWLVLIMDPDRQDSLPKNVFSFPQQKVKRYRLCPQYETLYSYLSRWLSAGRVYNPLQKLEGKYHASPESILDALKHMEQIGWLRLEQSDQHGTTAVLLRSLTPVLTEESSVVEASTVIPAARRERHQAIFLLEHEAAIMRHIRVFVR